MVTLDGANSIFTFVAFHRLDFGALSVHALGFWTHYLPISAQNVISIGKNPEKIVEIDKTWAQNSSARTQRAPKLKL